MRVTATASIAWVLVLLAIRAHAEEACSSPQVRDSGPCARLECLIAAHACTADAGGAACASERARFDQLRRELAACESRTRSRIWNAGAQEGLIPHAEFEQMDKESKRQMERKSRIWEFLGMIASAIGVALFVWWFFFAGGKKDEG